MDAITELDGKKYKYSYKLTNDKYEFEPKDDAINWLEVEDNLFTPFNRGTIVLSNPYNAIESSFLYRGDGSDKLEITLIPKGENNEEMGIKGTFIIVKEGNYIDNETPLNNRKFYEFIDEDESILNSRFSYGKRVRGKGHDILKELLIKNNFKIGEFEKCDFEIDELLPQHIIPTMNYRELDLIYYISRYNYAKEGVIGVKPFLKKNKKGDYTLTKISTIFKNHKKLFYEAFHTGDLVSSTLPNENNHQQETQNGVGYRTYIGDIPSYSLITPDKKTSNTYFMNSLVYSYDPISGNHHIEKIFLKDILEKWKKLFVDVFKLVGGKPKPFLNITENKEKDEFKIYRLPFNKIHNKFITEADLINHFIFLNQQLVLTTTGDLGRSSGKFIDFFKTKIEKDDNSDLKLLGRWLIVSATHIKIRNQLKTRLYCVKTSAGSKYKSETNKAMYT